MKTKTLNVLSLMALCINYSWADVIFDVNFEDPPHVVDQQVVLGSGSDRPQFGGTTVIVRDSPADFTTQAASLEPAGSFGFLPDTPFPSGIALISWDLAMVSSGGGAAISIGTTEGVPITMILLGDLSIEIDGTDVGSFTVGQHDNYLFEIDIDNALYDFSLNGGLVLNDQPLVGSGWELRNVNFSRPDLADPTYAVDNFQWQIIPEPSTLLLMLVASAGMWFRRKVAGSTAIRSVE